VVNKICYIKKIFCLVLIYFFFAPEINSQTTDSSRSKNIPKNFISISFGLSDFHVRDELASPLTYSGLGIASCLQYVRKCGESNHFFEFTAYYSNLKTNYETYYAPNLRLGFNYNYLHNLLSVKSKQNHFIINAGGGIFSFLSYSRYSAHIVPNIFMNRWIFTHSLEISSLFEYIFYSSNNFQVQLSFPVISNVSRPAYIDPPDNSGLTEPVKIFGTTVFYSDNLILKLKIKYMHEFKEWFDIFAQFDFQYTSYDVPRRISMYMNNFLVGTYFKF
jgi:hypothetical protein